MTWPHLRRSCNSGQSAKWQDRSVFICRGGPAVPRAAACGARRQCCGAGRSTVSLEKRQQHASLCSRNPSEPTAGSGNVQRFPESEVISAQPASRQANDPICHLHNPAIRTKTPGPGRASHGTRRKCCRAKCIQRIPSPGLCTPNRQNGSLHPSSPIHTSLHATL